MKLKLQTFTTFVFALISFSLKAQITQTISGRVIDADSRQPLAGVNIILQLDEANKTGTITDEQGYFKIENVPIGRRSIDFSFVGYEDVHLDNVIVTSGKEVELKIEMSESADVLGTAEVRVKSRFGNHNEMVTVSARTFDSEEAERYPGSRQDPARMVQNFAGVSGTDDQRNDIVVRGNSPLGLLWRFEGVDIFNPSHFAVAGSTGGPISMLNNKTIGNSDFMTGAFPADYGNGISGVFDIKMRNGNYNKSEFSGQFGLFGTELLAEGPINKSKKSSYMISYRYATLQIFQALGIDLGTSAVPHYQDACFRFNFPTKHGGFSVFGVGGLSAIDIVLSDDTIPPKELYGEKDRDQYFRTNMGVVGANWRHFINKSTFLNAVIAVNGQQIISNHDKIFRDPNEYARVYLMPVLRSTMTHSKTTAHVYVNRKLSARHNFRIGVITDVYQLNYFDSVRNEQTYLWSKHLNYQGGEWMGRFYASWKFRITADLTLNAGLHALATSLGNATALEPRAGLKWKISKVTNASFGYGLHSQLQPLYVYHTLFVDSVSHTFGAHNNGVGLSKSHHFVASLERIVNPFLRVRTEVYYQYLFNIPVEVISSSFSLLNQGSGFQRFFPDVLQNTGTGHNYGMELTVERSFHKNYYTMFTGSLYNSRYKGSDGVDRNTDFNGNFILNTLVGYEKPFGPNKKNAFTFGTRFTLGGGKRYSPIDSLATEKDGANVIFVDSERNSLQFRNYYRWDLKFGIRVNAKKTTHEFAIDVANVLNTKNVLTLSYFDDPDHPGRKIYKEETQLGRLPNFWYKFNF
ncbi:MAG: TonB-dependent receptor plug domain-containing protein [Bacteroidetes bacterium]|nr:TonB-dependent receptor plug domain-containing protein [Bacteroidota bacterium]